MDQLTTLLTGCVKQFSDLESLLGGLPTITATGSSLIDGPTWARNEKRLRTTIERIQPYRVSLFLMLQALELQPSKDQDESLERLQSELEELQDCMLSTDGDLAKRIGKVEARQGFTIAPTPPLDLEKHKSDPGDVTAAMRPTSPMSSSRGLHSADEKRRPAWISSWRSRSHRSNDSVQRLSRPLSATTSSSITSGSSISATSFSSRTSLAAVSNFSVYKLPITAEDVSNGHQYIGIVEEPAAIAEGDEESLYGRETAATSLPDRHRKALPMLVHSAMEPRASAVSSAPSGSGKQVTAPTAEVEMSARKYQGYWRPSFTADLPAVAAMCGTLLVTVGTTAGPATKLTESPETAARSATFCETLAQAPSPAKVIKTLQSHSLETLLFALKASLDSGRLPVVPTKIASAIYQKIAEAKNDPKKAPKLWQHVAKALKKVPPETMVPLMFLIGIGRRLRARGVMVGNRSAAAYLAEDLWPQPGSKSLFAQDTEAGDAATKLMLDNYDNIPDELPVVLQAVNYRFESGSRCNLLALLTTRKAPA
ncbi:hypothetical protein LTR36_000960 [Oleoguttula mirabilis]|uniref:Uncharacterized protein n=1 Tax=Oleoguttula mirabilis TaxID=1507867 RepID=A0AAV9JP19_9PEZI|nr:hypothetical protein LTR36_000960 [Oleoguttula mirabilis]